MKKKKKKKKKKNRKFHKLNLKFKLMIFSNNHSTFLNINHFLRNNLCYNIANIRIIYFLFSFLSFKRQT